MAKKEAPEDKVMFECLGLGYTAVGVTEKEAIENWKKESGESSQEHCVIHQVTRLG